MRHSGTDRLGGLDGITGHWRRGGQKKRYVRHTMAAQILQITRPVKRLGEGHYNLILKTTSLPKNHDEVSTEEKTPYLV